jgi:hypothetical protein
MCGKYGKKDISEKNCHRELRVAGMGFIKGYPDRDSLFILNSSYTY